MAAAPDGSPAAPSTPEHSAQPADRRPRLFGPFEKFVEIMGQAEDAFAFDQKAEIAPGAGDPVLRGEDPARLGDVAGRDRVERGRLEGRVHRSIVSAPPILREIGNRRS